MSNLKRTSTTPERLKIAMANAKVKQIELARLSGIARGTINNYVLGKYEPKSDAINKMAIALNVSEMWLWGYDVPMEREKKVPDKLELSEDDKAILEIFRLIPEEQRRAFLEMGRAYANSLKKD